MLNPSTAFQTTTTNHWQLCSISTVLTSYKLSRIRVPFRRGFLRISISILYPSISVTASALIISLNRTSGTLLRARFAQHGFFYQANVLLSLVMCAVLPKSAHGSMRHYILRHYLARLPPHGQRYLILPLVDVSIPYY